MPPMTPSTALLATLPEQTQARLRQIGAAHRTEFGTCRHYQAAFDEHLAFLEGLIGRGADHRIIGQLLAEVGIARADGSPLPLGTVSGALSRARERAAAAAAAAAAKPNSGDPPTGSALQDAAGQRSPRPDTAGPRRATQVPAGRRNTAQAPAEAVMIRPAPAEDGAAPRQISSVDNPPGGAQRAADILTRLRSRQ